MSDQSVNKFTCKFCNKGFSHRNHMYRHMKHSCKMRKLSENGVEIDDHTNDTTEIEKTVENAKTTKTTETTETTETAEKKEINGGGGDVAIVLEKRMETLVDIIKTQQDQITQQKDQIDTLIGIMKSKPIHSGDTCDTSSNHKTIYVINNLNYLEILSEKLGDQKQAVEFIKSKLYGNIQGDVDVFAAIHLDGPPNTWPIRCPDKSKKNFYLVQPDNSMISDPGGVTIHRYFSRNLQNAMLRIINMELTKVVDHDVGSEKFETLRDNLLDDFDLRTFQDRALELSSQKPIQFVKQLIDKISEREMNIHK